MKYIKCELGRVVEVGAIKESDWDSFLEAMGENAVKYKAVEEDADVWKGCTWDSETEACIRDPEPPESITLVNLDMVKTKLDNLREAYINQYIGIWGRVSSQMLWPVLDQELQNVNTDVLEIIDTPERKPIPWPRFPSLRGYIGARLSKNAADVTDDEVRATATALQRKKAEHTKILTCTEMIRNKLISDFTFLTTDVEKHEFYRDLEDSWGTLNAQT